VALWPWLPVGIPPLNKAPRAAAGRGGGVDIRRAAGVLRVGNADALPAGPLTGRFSTSRPACGCGCARAARPPAASSPARTHRHADPTRGPDGCMRTNSEPRSRPSRPCHPAFTTNATRAHHQPAIGPILHAPLTRPHPMGARTAVRTAGSRWFAVSEELSGVGPCPLPRSSDQYVRRSASSWRVMCPGRQVFGPRSPRAQYGQDRATPSAADVRWRGEFVPGPIVRRTPAACAGCWVSPDRVRRRWGPRGRGACACGRPRGWRS
jgi:hypothetical protein